MADTALIRLAMAMNEKNAQEQRRQAQKEFLQRTAKTLSGAGEAVEYNYAEVMFGKDVTKDQFISHLVSTGETQASAELKANFTFKTRSRMMYEPQMMMALQAEGQSLGIPRGDIASLIAQVAGEDSFVGQDDMAATLLREANSFQSWMRSGVNRTSEPIAIDPNKRALSEDAEGASGPVRLTDDLLGSMKANPQQFPDGPGGLLGMIGQMSPRERDNLFFRNNFMVDMGGKGGPTVTANDGNSEVASAMTDYLQSRDTTKQRAGAIGGAGDLKLTDSNVDDLVRIGEQKPEPAQASQQPGSSGANAIESALGGQKFNAVDPRYRARDLSPIEKEILKHDKMIEEAQMGTFDRARRPATNDPLATRALEYLKQ